MNQSPDELKSSNPDTLPTRIERTLFTCAGGHVVLPATILCGRMDGGHLIVNPPRPVWERNEMSPKELVLWSLLVAATGKAMLSTLAQLRGACLNYWEAGNWSLHDAAQPKGPKDVQQHRRVHLHIFGRSRTATHPDWQWGESPRFPNFETRLPWASAHAPLSLVECDAIVSRCKEYYRKSLEDVGLSES